MSDSMETFPNAFLMTKETVFLLVLVQVQSGLIHFHYFLHIIIAYTELLFRDRRLIVVNFKMPNL